MDRKFHNKVIALLPSKDLIACIKAERFTFGEEDLLAFINDYAPDFETKLALFGEAVTAFSDKTAINHAKKLIAFNKRAYSKFIEADENCVYETDIKCLPEDADEETLITKTFGDALSMIKSFLKCYADVGAKDNPKARYKITKKTTFLPKHPRDVYNGKVGDIGECVLGYKFKILDLWTNERNNEINCKNGTDCEDCKTPCVGSLTPSFPHFLKKYDLVGYYSGRLYAPSKINYGIFMLDMEECDNDTYVIDLDNAFIKDRKVTFQDESGYYGVYNAHCHPSYAELFKPENVPEDIYNDYLYAVAELKKLENG